MASVIYYHMLFFAEKNKQKIVKKNTYLLAFYMYIFIQGPPTRLLVAAIDLGTTFSGYAFSFRHEYLSDRLRISTNLWPHNNGMSMKAPTSILLDPEGEVKAFGYEAIKTFGDLAEYNQHVDYYFFNKFKMNLYQQGVSYLRDFFISFDLNSP